MLRILHWLASKQINTPYKGLGNAKGTFWGGVRPKYVSQQPPTDLQQTFLKPKKMLSNAAARVMAQRTSEISEIYIQTLHTIDKLYI